MTTEQDLRKKLRKISALFEGATTVGERNAAEAAIDRVRKALARQRKLNSLSRRSSSHLIAGTDDCSLHYAAATD
jgi:hypothetical protein